MGTGGIHIAAGHVSHVVVAGVLIGHAAQGSGRMYMIGIAVSNRPGRAGGHTIQYIVAIGLLVGRGRRSCWRESTMITACWRPAVSRPDQAILLIVTKALVLYRYHHHARRDHSEHPVANDGLGGSDAHFCDWNEIKLCRVNRGDLFVGTGPLLFGKMWL
jgi:hypothetical protein